MKRAFLIVLDACGVGAMPDWQEFNDPASANTLANVAKACGGLNLPNLEKLGLGNIIELQGVKPQTNPLALWGKAAEKSLGKDTTTGHWEMAGLMVDNPFPVYPNGFPAEIINEFIQFTGCGGVLGNIPASGTDILIQLGEKHLETGWPIIYTSADSVFQIATNVSKIPLETLYSWCEKARKILCNKHEVSRVIARPFDGNSAKEFYRLSEYRHDYAIEPTGETILSFLQKNNCQTISVGKIRDIFCEIGIDQFTEGKSNEACLGNIISLLKEKNQTKPQFIFANLVETDSHFGHRNDAKGFGLALEKIDLAIGECLKLMTQNDLMILTADHGCDPTVAGTDHTREYIPILAYSKAFEEKSNKNIGIRPSFLDTATSIADWFGLSDNWIKTIKTESESYIQTQ